jgi:hypothetical protein
MKNYKNYFESDNSCNLIDKFSVEKRTGSIDEECDFLSDLRSKNYINENSATSKNCITPDARPSRTRNTLKQSLKTLSSLKFRQGRHD